MQPFLPLFYGSKHTRSSALPVPCLLCRLCCRAAAFPWDPRVATATRPCGSVFCFSGWASWAVFTSKISLSKLHYLLITSNFLSHTWSIKYIGK